MLHYFQNSLILLALELPLSIRIIHEISYKPNNTTFKELR